MWLMGFKIEDGPCLWSIKLYALVIVSNYTLNSWHYFTIAGVHIIFKGRVIIVKCDITDVRSSYARCRRFLLKYYSVLIAW